MCQIERKTRGFHLNQTLLFSCSLYYPYLEKYKNKIYGGTQPTRL
jgi:hypothetical protein